MRFAFAPVALVCLFSASAHAEVVQAELNGHVDSIYSFSQSPRSYYTSYAGFSVGEPIQALVHYDNSPVLVGPVPPLGPPPFGLTLNVKGTQLIPDPSASPYVQLSPDSMVIANALTPTWSGSHLSAWFYANDPQSKLFGSYDSPGGLSFPGSAALAGYSPQGNAGIYLGGFLESSDTPTIVIAVDSLSVDGVGSLAVQAPEPSALVLFGLGGLSLLGLAPWHRAARRQKTGRE